MAEVSGDLGINYRMLGNWVRAEQRRQGQDGPHGEAERLELNCLRREDSELKTWQ